MAAELDPEIQTVVGRLLAEVETLNQRIAEYSSQIENLAEEHYTEAAGLKKINCFGTLVALMFVLTVDDPHRFRPAEISVVTWECDLDAPTLATVNRRCISVKKAITISGA